MTVTQRVIGRKRFDLSTRQIVRLYKSGLSTYPIAARLDTTPRTIARRLKRAGIILRGPRAQKYKSGAEHPLWKGGRLVDKQGYVIVAVGPCRRRLEHRVVMEAILGRRLKKSEYVHHINGIRHDNRPENLVVTAPSKHESRTLIKALQRRIAYLESHVRCLAEAVRGSRYARR